MVQMTDTDDNFHCPHAGGGGSPVSKYLGTRSSPCTRHSSLGALIKHGQGFVFAVCVCGRSQ